MQQVICAWTSYKGGFCKKIIVADPKRSVSFCTLHTEMSLKYSKVTGRNDQCETWKDIKVSPRSYRHIRSLMENMGYDDEDSIQVVFPGGSVEDANISNIDYICIDSDESKFYYNFVKGQKRTNSLKVLLRSFCKNEALISFGGVKYCEECYKKMKDVPRISLITDCLE